MTTACWWTCPKCGGGHNRGFFPIGSTNHRCLRCGYMGDGGTIGHQPMLLRVQPHASGPDRVLVTWEANEVESVSVVRIYWSSVDGDIDADQVSDPPRMPEVVMRELLEGLRERYHADRDMTIDGLVDLVWG